MDTDLQVVLPAPVAAGDTAMGCVWSRCIGTFTLLCPGTIVTRWQNSITLEAISIGFFGTLVVERIHTYLEIIGTAVIASSLASLRSP